MKFYNKIIIFALVCFSACDMLDKTPQSEITPESYFRTATDLQLFSNTFYNNLLDKSIYNHQNDHFIGATLSTYLSLGDFRLVPNDGGGWDWNDLRKINTLLAYADNCNDKEAVDLYTAIARFFRAYDYTEKLMEFGDVPWIDRELGSDDPQLYAPRDNRELIMTKILEDLDYAIERLPSKVTTYRVNKYAALALKARVCLNEGTFRKYHKGQSTLATLPEDAHDADYYLELAYKAAEQIMNDGKYSLQKSGNSKDDYRLLFAQEEASTQEAILAINFNYSIGIGHDASAVGMLSTMGRRGFTRKFIDSYLTADGKPVWKERPQWATESFADQMKDRDPRLAQTIRSVGYVRPGDTNVLYPDFSCSCTGYQTIKYVRPSNAPGSDKTGESSNDLIQFRYAEVLLIYAEAKAELGILDDSDLDKSINLIRARAGMPKLSTAVELDTYLVYGAEPCPEIGYRNINSSLQNVIIEIRRERAIEFAQEYRFRHFDLMRWREGKRIEEPMYGMYFDKLGDHDLDGDGKADIHLYVDTPEATSAAMKLQISVAENDTKGVRLSEKTYGYVQPHYFDDIDPKKCRVFNEERDYFYPLPSDDLRLNDNLVQNSGYPEY